MKLISIRDLQRISATHPRLAAILNLRFLALLLLVTAIVSLPIVSADISKSFATAAKLGSGAAVVPQTGKPPVIKSVSALVREARLLETNQQMGLSSRAFTPQASFTPGNLVVMRFGDGSASITSAATPAFLDEYTTSGTLVQSVALPTTTSGSNKRLAVSGTASSEGELALSVDGRYLTAIGYDVAVGTVGVTSSTSATINRVIARVDANGSIDTTTALTDAASGSNPRGAVSTDGTNLWIDGGAGGIRFTTLGSTTSTQLSTTVTNLRHTNIFGGQLYVSSGSGAFRLASVGSGTPQTSGQVITNLPGITTLTSPYGFFFADLDAGVAGADTVYIADDSSGGGIFKFSLVGGSWVSNGNIGSTGGLHGLTGKVTGSSVTLYAGGTSSLVTLTDNSGYNATITGSISSLATSGTNKQFRGVAFAPVAGPTNPSGVGAANPNPVLAGNSTLLTVTVTPGTNPASTALAVTADLTSIGGSATQTFLDDGNNGDVTAGDNIFSFQATVDTGISAGAKSIPVTITDGQARTGSANISLTVAGSAPPSGVGSAAPNPATINTSTLLKVTVTPGVNPASTGLAVTADLTAIGGSASQQFFDDGSNGDVTPGDNIFSFSATIPGATTAGAKSLPFTITDAQTRSGSGSISLSVQLTAPTPGAVVMSQVYGGGGNSGATLKNDFIELFNRSQSAVDITGWSLQRLTSAGTGPWEKTVLSGIIQPGQYLLVQEAAGAGGSVNLPTPDLTGTMTLGAGAGILALVNNSTTLADASCPSIGANLIDLVGYGAAACFEGTGAAPTLGNTTAALRTHGGCKDTDDNSVDFKVAQPAPRNSSSPLNICTVGDLAPEVFNTNPADGGLSVPVSSTISVTFDEAVNVTSNWFTISCATSGSHTGSFTGGPTTFTITPDAPFGSLEQCTVTVLASQVTDQDAIDPPDNMAANFVFSFTTASDGSEHLLFGNPSGAVSDPINFSNNYLMNKPQYALSYNGTKGTPNWTSWHLDSTWLGSAPRQDDFRNDTSLPPNFYQVLGTDYSGSGFDRGHMCPSADRTSSIPDNSATFLMDNMVPQSPDNNQGPWENLESYLRAQVTAGNELYIISGPVGQGGTGSNGPASLIAGGHVVVPAATWKVALILPVGTNDVSRVTTSTRTIAIIIPNVQGIKPDLWQKYITTVRNVENLTGYNFFSAVPQNIQDVIETRIDPANAPAVAVFGTKTVSGSFTPGGSITYTVVLTNAGNSTQPDNSGNEFTDVLPAGVTLVSASATSGTAVPNTGTNTVTWNGSIASASSVTITINATVSPSATAGTVISNQGTIAFDSEANGSNESSALTDDPNVVGVSNTTDFTVVNPTPAISTLNPTSDPQNSSGGTVTISGSGFIAGSVVRYDGADHATSFVNNSTLTITLAASDTATTGAKTVAVFNGTPGGGLSNTLLFTITQAGVVQAQTVDTPPDSSVTASVFGPTVNDPSLTATLLRTPGGPADATLYVAEYTGNPTGTNIFDVGGGFLDLQVTNAGPNDSVTAKFYYPATITGQTETDLKLFFFNGTNWQAIKSSGGADPIKDTSDNLDGTISGGRITVVFDSTSTPQISQLTGTVITMSTVSTPTAVDFDSARAVRVGNSVVIQWKTGMEVNNLGFNVYRQNGGERVQVNPSLIAGTALMVGSDVKLQSGYTYTWTDDAADSKVSYWIESIDLDGTSEWHGPFGVSSSFAGPIGRTRSALLNNLTSSAARQTNAVIQREYPAGFGNSSSHGSTAGQTNGRTPTKPSSIPASLQKQWQVASQPAIKLAINKTGWYRVNAADLMAAGLNANTSPVGLQMFVGGVEVPIKVNSADGARFVPTDSIEFYGVGLDTPTTDTQVYWLTAGLGTGKRINVQLSPGSSSGNGPNSFQLTVERKDRSLYFSSLRNGDAENWFGSVVSTNQVSESINIHNHDANGVGQAQIETALQGVTANTHQVNVSLNGQVLNLMTFAGQEHPVLKLSIPESFLIEGDNMIAFAAQTSGDVSLVDYVRITYAHTYTAENNTLSASVTGAMPVKVTGFTSNQIMVIDVANANQPIQLDGTIDGDPGNYSISVDGAKRRNLLVFTPDKVLQPLSITANQPSTLSKASNGADFVIITSRAFAQSVQPLADLRQSQGYQVEVVDVDSVFNEFSYGVHNPYAVKDFLNWTYLHWQKQPQFVMLAGGGTLDPRNYTGAGFMDFVPTKLIDTDSMETSSDDWFVDFNNDGKPQMSIGRLPANSVAEADLIINKIIAYEHSDGAQAMVLVSDRNDGIDFDAANSQVKAVVPSNLSVININRDQSDARTTLLNQFDQSGRIINYAGHGSVNLWRGGLLTANDMASLANRKTSPLVVTMTCLNGYFQDPKLESLGESLLKVNNGGAVSVWASSGMTDFRTQTAMNQEFFRQLFGSATITLGEAIKAAKAATFDNDVRRTWILFGDPTMRIKR